MNVKAAKELLHIQSWFERVEQLVERGKEAYPTAALLQEAGDSLMMNLGAAANRLAKLGVLATASSGPWLLRTGTSSSTNATRSTES